MAPNFFLLTEQAIDSAKSLTSGETEQLFKLNKRQCKYVAQKLSESREVLQVLKSAVGESVACNCEAALKEFYRVATDALSLIKDCRREPWLKAAITQRSSEDFAEVCYDLQWCTSILCSISFQGTTRATYSQIDISQPEGCDGRLGAFDLFRLETAAKQDQEDLRSNLELHVCDASCVRSPAEPCLAAHVLKRLDNRPSALGAAPMTRNSPSSLWQVDPQDLPEGKHLGRGTFGDVYQTEWLGESYAKKVFREASGDSFKVEAEILAVLCHPHVVRTVCWSRLQKKRDYSLVMDLMEEDLSEFLHPTLDDSDDDSNDVAAVPLSTDAAAVPLSTDAAVDLMLQTARGLRYLHSKSIVHRDVKSKNILVKRLTDVPELKYEEGYLTVKLADFGTSRIKKSVTRRSHQTLNVGTTEWMAPEVVRIQEEWMYADAAQSSPIAHPHKADVWSFAMVCFEILTRKVPFKGEMLTRLFHRITVDGLRPVLPDECPRRLVSLIQRCWEYDPCERPDFTEICNELQYIKGLLLTGDKIQIQKVDVRCFVTKPIEVQGPWGGSSGNYFSDGLATGIRQLKVRRDHGVFLCLWVEYDICGHSFQSRLHGEATYGSEEEITFNYPAEYLQQIEGFVGKIPVMLGNRQVTGISSISFKSNIKTYGPYGGGGGETPFKSGIGKIVGFWGKSGLAIDQIGVFIVNPT